MTKFQETMATAQAGAVARLLQIITPILLMLLGWYYIGADTAKVKALDDMRIQLGVMSIQIARLEEQGGGARQNQATVDAEQNRRIERIETRMGTEPF